ncbi:heparan-alpha-glucosaminide N-acetyltransferase domain-containing protein [Agrococcus lahaulensis]|uniref:heparan-alpha-glucosaminide N-acetyltransferase domain-containing protein n=1 Tax=Agrococcus lahaulensis TaxID=341722 RepID=UPI0006851CDB|nr:heparan-alpha-glucosaminide N-acetyltransferase domain-containing protein [Agrococcus lahaulensis]
MAGTRLVGIDLARLTAVAGMMAAHTVLWEEPAPGVVALVDGPPSTLFAVLGGVSVVLASRQRLAAGDRAGAMRSTLARGAVVALLGILVAPLATAVFVVLVPFGVSIVLAGLLVTLPSWALAALAAALWAAGGSLVATARASLPAALEDPAGTGDALLAATLDVVLTGVYPVVTWLAYLLVGMLLARALLAARARGRERRALATVGVAGAALIAAAVAASELGVRLVAETVLELPAEAMRDSILMNAYGAAQGTEPAWQLVAAPHSGTPADMARTIGIGLVAIALLGLLAASLPPRALRAFEPLRAAGAAPLTIYVVHVVLLSTLALADPALATGWGAWAAQLAIAIAIGAVLAVTRSRGPLERLVGTAATRAAGTRERAATASSE